MTEKCEFIIVSQAVRGELVLCGKPGVSRRVSRPLAVEAPLCDSHAQTMARQGFEIDPLDRMTLQSIEAERRGKPAMSLPLFDAEEER